ncbi:MAG TPA: choice-of-anchor G family protein [Jatrophihabitantaceae bacterium]
MLAALTAAGVAVAFAPTASAAPTPVSQAAGRFLSGSIGGTDLNKLVAVKGENAANNGGAAVTNQHSLNATLLNAQLLNLPNGIQLPGGGVIKLGAVNQYAQANNTGGAHGASGAVTNSGAVGLGEQNGSPQDDASIDLTNTPLAQIGGLKLTVGALAATADQATGKNGAQTGSYELANVKLQLSSPTLGSAVKALTGGSSNVPGLSDLIGKLGGNGLNVAPLQTVSTKNSVAPMSSAVGSLGDINVGDGAIQGSLTNGTLSVDVAKLLKTVLNLDINNLPPNTHLLEYIARALPEALAHGLSELKDQLTALFDKLSLNLNGVLPASKSQASSALDELLAPLTNALDNGAKSLSDSVFVPLAKAAEKLVDVIVNVQEHNNGTFTERALRVDVIGDPVARLNLASASVGPGTGPNGGGSSTPPGNGPSTPGAPHNGNGGGGSLANTGPSWAARAGLFALLALGLGGAMVGATISVRRLGKHHA